MQRKLPLYRVASLAVYPLGEYGEEDFDDLVGIHPTDAEAFCAMEVRRKDVKSPEDYTASGGCGGGKCG